jgi:hypothetical protein
MKRIVLLLAALAMMLDLRAASKVPGVEDLLRGFSEKYSKAEIDFFYVSPVVQLQKKEYVYVYWMTGNSIIIVDLPTGKREDYWWYWHKARIDLSNGVVPKQEDIAGSTYLSDAAWVEEKLKACLISGDKIVIKKEANQALVPTPMSVTPAADAPVAPATGAAHL